MCLRYLHIANNIRFSSWRSLINRLFISTEMTEAAEKQAGQQRESKTDNPVKFEQTRDQRRTYLPPEQTRDQRLKYPPPEQSRDQRHKYPFPEQIRDQRLKYPFPEQTRDQRLKYPFPEQTRDQRLKYPPPEQTRHQRLTNQQPKQIRDQRLKYTSLKSEQTPDQRLNYPSLTFEQMPDQRLKYPSLTSEKMEKLEKHFQHIISNAQVDFANQEIQDIQKAVYTMLERIRIRVNRRDIFNIARIQPCGSMAEKTSIWKYSRYYVPSNEYLEFDFLARLENAIEKCDDQTEENNCQCCIRIVNQHVELEQLRHYYNSGYDFNASSLKRQGKRMISTLFLKEINYCLAYACDCLSIRCDKHESGILNFSLKIRPSAVKRKHGCDECTVDMSTGTLHINTAITIDQGSPGPTNCSLIFLWTSKSNRLSTQDKQLLQKPQPISSLPILLIFCLQWNP